MTRHRATRTAAVLLACCALACGGAIAPAAATPAKEAANLAVLKQTWNTLSPATQASTCQVYGTSHSAVISTGVQAMMNDRRLRRGMSNAAWKRVLTKYYTWACGGPGGTPR